MKSVHRADYLHFISPVVFVMLAFIFSPSSSNALFAPPFLLQILNTTLLALLPFIVAFFAARAYARQGNWLFVLFGCAMVGFGMGSLLAGWGLTSFGQNFLVTIHNAGALISGLCLLGALALITRVPPAKAHPAPRNAFPACAMCYSAVVLLLLAVALLSIKGRIPRFFVQNQGPTPIRQVVLVIAVIAYALSAIQCAALRARTDMQFLGLTALGIALTGIGLAIFLMEKSVDSAFCWSGRASQYAGSIYFGAAMLVGMRETWHQGSSLPAYLDELFRSGIDEQVRIRTRELVALNKKLSHEAQERKLAEEKLRESEQTYRSVIEKSLQGMAIVQDGRIVLCNEALCRMSGYSKEEISVMTREQVIATVHPEDRSAAIEAMQALNNAGDSRSQRVIRIIHKSGKLRWVEMLGAPLVYKGMPALQVYCMDITERREAEESYRPLIDHAIFGMAIVQNGRIVLANAALSHISGYSMDELLSLSSEQVASVVHSDDRNRVLENMSKRLDGRESPPTQLFKLIHKDGSVRWVEARLMAVEYEGSPGLQVSYRDATAETAAEEQLRKAHASMRNLAAHVLHAREEERREVAREIHDELGQTLAALTMDLHWLVKRLGGETDILREKLLGTIELGERAINTVQRIAANLRPRMLDDLGLAAALEWLGADFSRRTKIECKVTTDIPAAVIGRNSATALYRVAQEALTNVGRHSHADHAAVRMFVSDGMLILQIEDDGIGITTEQAEAPGSFGLMGIRERLGMLGGSLTISAEPGFGAVLVARIPFP